jgi:hypothetical protein
MMLKDKFGFFRKELQTRVMAIASEGFAVELNSGERLESEKVVFAMGGWQDREAMLAQEIVPQVTLSSGYTERCVLTGELFASGTHQVGLQGAMNRAAQKIVILGGSHSAVLAAKLFGEVVPPLGQVSISLLYRRAPRLFFPDRESAVCDGYTEFGDDDVCPNTGRVFRLAGLRMAARDLMRCAWRLGGLEGDERLIARCISELTRCNLRVLLDSADVIVPAFGYRPRTLPVFDSQGHRIDLLAEKYPFAPLVNHHCQVLRADGEPIPGLLGIGLASGFNPFRAGLGGERSFEGQTNGLWLYHNDVGRIILDHISVGHSRLPF